MDKPLKSLKNSDFATINNVMETVLKGIETNISYDDLLPAAMNLTKYHISETTGFPTAREDANMGRKGACVIPATLESNVKLLHEFLFGEENYEPSDKVKQISAKISSDSGKYKEAAPISSVGTDGGYIPSPTTQRPRRKRRPRQKKRRLQQRTIIRRVIPLPRTLWMSLPAASTSAT